MQMLKYIFTFFFCAVGMVAFAQEPSDLLKSHFEAHGQELWNEVQSVTIDGKWIDAQYYGYPMKLTFKSPDKIRLEGVYKQRKYAEAFDGRIAWVIAPWKDRYEVQLMKAQEELVLRNVFTMGSPLYPYREHLTFIGLSDVEGILYHTFVHDEPPFKRTFYLDRDDHRLYYERIETKFGREPVGVLRVVDKYKSYNGLLVPAAVIFEGASLTREFVFEQIYLGMGANDRLFEMPKGQ